MPVVDTNYLFKEDSDKVQLAGDLVKVIFPTIPIEAIQYELMQQGLLQKGTVILSIDVWQLIDQQLKELMHEWDGPDIPVYIFPITDGYSKNGIAYPKGICLYISAALTAKELHALFAHEYHHMCRRSFSNDPPTLLDSILMEGLAEDAVETLFGNEALSPWTQDYSLDEVMHYWDLHFLPVLDQQGLHHHKPFLFGNEYMNLPPWIGYCIGYRIVQAFKERNVGVNIRQLLQLKSEHILDGAGFNKGKEG